MFANQPRALHAAKVAGSVVVVYALSLQWAWINPYWAGFAVLFCAATTQGESLNKSIHRILGTVLGTCVAFLILAVFSQDRWPFLAASCIYLAFATYKLTGTKASYFWQTSGVVAMIILPLFANDSADIFEIAMARSQETILGCLIWTLVDMLVLPVTNSGSLQATAARLARVQSQLFDYCRAQSLQVAQQPTHTEVYTELRTEQVGLVAQLGRLLAAAGAENQDVRERREYWAQLVNDSKSLVHAFDRWADTLVELSHIDLQAVAPESAELLDTGSEYFRRSAQVWDAEPLPPADGNTEPSQHSSEEHFAYFDQAAATLSARNLGRVRDLAQRLRRTSAAINSELVAGVSTVKSAQQSSGMLAWVSAWVPDRDRVNAAAFVAIVGVCSFVIWVLFDPPGHSSYWSITTLLGLVAASMPHVRIGMAFFKVFAMVLPVSAAIYIFVMPTLTTFAELSLLMFVFLFCVQYYLKNPLMIVLGCVGFLLISGITNEQSYSFVGVAVTYLFLLLATLTLAAASYLLGSPRPEKHMLRLMRRYFRSAELLLRDHDMGHWRQAFHRQEIALLPQKMRMWGAQIDRDLFPEVSAEQSNALIARMEGLNYRIEDFIELRGTPQAPAVTQAISTHLHAWAAAMHTTFGQVAGAEEVASTVELRANVERRLHAIEGSLNDLVASAAGDELTKAERTDAYSLLGAYRGLANAALNWMEFAEQVDLRSWREESFS